MRATTCLVCVCVIAMNIGAAAQKPVSGSMSDALQQHWEGAKRNMQESAKKMDEANYAFRPVDSVRTFGQILAHVAGASYVFCSAARGEKTPHEEDDFEKTATTKAQIVKVLNDSIAYCDAAYTSLTDRTAAEVMPMPFGGK